MKRYVRMLLVSMALLAMGDGRGFAQGSSPPDSSPRPSGPNVPDTAQREILRRGNLAERLGNGHRDDAQVAITEALRPPADDSHKWFVSLVTTGNCASCERLKRDFAQSPHLQAFVDVEDHTQSWAHYNVYPIEDATQAWRFREIKLTGYPTLIIQPPRNGRFGDPKTVVLQKTGYEGDPKKLADAMRSGIATYVRTQARQRPAPRSGVRQEATGQPVISYEPPFTPPPKVDPNPSYPPYSFDIPPAPTPQPVVNPLTLLVSLLAGLMSSGGLTNLLLLVIAGLAVIRTFRKATGQKLLLDDAAFQSVIDTLKSLTNPTPPKGQP